MKYSPEKSAALMAACLNTSDHFPTIGRPLFAVSPECKHVGFESDFIVWIGCMAVTSNQPKQLYGTAVSFPAVTIPMMGETSIVGHFIYADDYARIMFAESAESAN